jgi:hypothetical protein
MIAAGNTLRSFTRGFFRHEERVRPSRWCTRLHLPAGKQETEPGRVCFDSRPYLREILDSLDDPTVTDEVFVAPTRMGKTFTLRMAFAYSIAGDPAPTLWVDSTETKAKDVSKKELQPLIEANFILRSRKPANRHNFTDLRMLFPAAAFTMVGGNSDAQVAGDTVKRVFGNELDKWRGASDKEASIAELVRHRTESFEEERKHFWSSTPTLEELTTWTYFLRTDQRQFRCICPDCHHPQALIWEGVNWDPAAQITEHKWDLRAVKATARYRCQNPACGSHWTDAMRHLAIRHADAHWHATALGQPGWRGHHLNGLYGPLKSNNVGELTVDFLNARNTGFWSDRRDFWNSRMGMPWRENVGDVSVEKFAKLSRPYRRGEAGPEGFRPDLVIIEFDVQSYGIWYVVRAWAWTGASYLVDHGKTGSFADLEKIQQDYRKLGGTSYVIGDIHFEDRRAETLEAIYRNRDRGWFGAEGFEILSDLVKLEKANVFLGGSRQKEGITVTKLSISTYHFKVELEKRFTGEILNWFVYSLQTELLGASETELEEQREYFTQLLDERRVPRKRMLAGKPAFEFRSRNKNNHFFDCAVYGLALFWVLSKRRSYATRTGGAVERKTIEISTS